MPHYEQPSDSHVHTHTIDQEVTSSDGEHDLRVLRRQSRPPHKPPTTTETQGDGEVNHGLLRALSPIDVASSTTSVPSPPGPAVSRQHTTTLARSRSPLMARRASPEKMTMHVAPASNQWRPQTYADTATTDTAIIEEEVCGEDAFRRIQQQQQQVMLQRRSEAPTATSSTFGQHYQQQQQQSSHLKRPTSLQSHRRDLSPPPSPPPTPPPIRGEDKHTHHGNKDRDLLRVLAERGGGGRSVAGRAPYNPVSYVRQATPHTSSVVLESAQASHTHTRHSRDQSGIEYNDGADDMAIRVVVRKRPLSGTEMSKGDRDVLEIRSAGQVLVHEPKTKVDLTKVVETQEFFFDDAFEETTCNEQIYGRVIWPLVRTAMQGGKASCFAYGQTGSGMTI